VERLISEINEIMHLGHFGVELGLPALTVPPPSAWAVARALTPHFLMHAIVNGSSR